MKSIKLKKILALLTAITIIAVIFAGCGKAGENTPSDAIKTAGTDIAETGEVDLISVEKYVADYVSLPAEMAQIINLRSYENQVYFAAFVAETGQEQADESAEGNGTDYSVKLYKLNTDGTGLTELSGYTAPEAPEGKEGIMSLSAMDIDNDGNIWVVESNNSTSVKDNVILLRKLDATGAELYRADISDLAENKTFVFITGMQIDNSGNIYLADMSYGLYVYDNQGKQIYSLEAPNQPVYINSLFKMTDGRIVVHMSGTGGYTIKPVNPDSKSWEADIPINRAFGSYSGSGEYDFYYNNGSGLFGYNLENNEGMELLAWHDCYINGQNLNSVEVLSDGTIFAASYQMDGETVTAELILITTKTVTESTNKITLKLALFGVDPGIRTAVAEFNKENAPYYIEVVDYLQMGSAEDLNTGLTKLHTEIISGNVPDILCTLGALPLDLYIAKGMLEDLYPYIDNDTDLGGREAFIPEVLKALETEGSLYQITPGFVIYTVVGKKDIVGDRTSWTFDELIELLEQHPEIKQIMPNATADDALSLLSMNLDDFVNWQTGECRFTDESFIKLLEFANRFPKNAPDSSNTEDSFQMIKDGRALLNLALLSSIFTYQYYNISYGGDISFIGYPCENGSGNAFYITSGISVFSKCEHKDAAWKFIRLLLTEKYQTSADMWTFPISKTAFDKQIQDAMKKETTVDENGEVVEIPKGSTLVDNQIIEIFAATQEDIDKIMELIGSIDKILSIDRELMEIISEEAQAYFNGQKSAKDTAAIIQQRVSTYVNEQK